MRTHEDGPSRDGPIDPASPNGSTRICPTRIDHAPVLFAHKVIASMCQDRQRGHYHKCFTCAWNNTWVQAHGDPLPASGVERRAFVRAG